MSLPTLSVSINCGSCYGLVECDGDGYTCQDCGLHWGSNDPFDDTPAEFLDEDATPCEQPSGDREHVDVRPFETVNGVVKSWRRWGHVYAACVLPKDHASDHGFPMTTTYTDHTEKP